jgi:hypothetical protein
MFGFCSIRRFQVYCSQDDTCITVLYFNKIRIFPFKSVKPVKPIKTKDGKTEFGPMSYYYYPNPYEATKKANLNNKDDKDNKDKK